MKKINLKKNISNPKFFISVLLVIGFFTIGHFVHANFIVFILGGFFKFLIQGVVYILIVVVNLLVSVASYSDFIHAPAVTKGWVVVRDVCNMFFVLILLIISFATVLGNEEYGAKKNLQKLILAAVLINFSKMFCGLMIDVANVFMLTFVNAFKDIAGSNMVDMLGISSVVEFGKDTKEVNENSTAIAYFFGLIYVLIALVVVVSMLGMLVMRLVMMWIYIVLSPAAFFLQAVPGKGQSYATQWWTKWTSNLIVGPVIAFFLWLSFAAMQGSDVVVIGSAQGVEEAKNVSGSSPITSEAGSTAGFAKFAIGIGLLLGGMKIAQEVGGETGAALGKGMGYINKGKALAVGGLTTAAVGASKMVGRKARDASLSLAGGLTGGRKTNVGNFALQWRDEMQAKRVKTKAAAKEKFLGKIGIGNKTAVIGKKIKDDLNDPTSKYHGIGTAMQVGKHLGIAGGAMLAGDLVGGVSGVLAAAGAGIPASLLATAGTAASSNFTPIAALLTSISSRVVNADSHRAAAKKKADDYASDPAGLAADEAVNNHVKTRKGMDPSYKPSADEQEALDRLETNEKNKKFGNKKSLGKKKTNFIKAIAGDGELLKYTGKAFDNITQKQADAQKRVDVISNDPTHYTGAGKNGIYRNTGITERDKLEMDILNNAKSGSSDERALNNIINQVNSPAGSANALTPEELKALAQRFAAYKGDDKVNINNATLGRLEAALVNKGQDPAAYHDTTLRDYKPLDETMKVDRGKGDLAYNTFANNAMKKPGERQDRKDVLGVSFGQLNDVAKAKGIDFKIDEKAGSNEDLSGPQAAGLRKVMTHIIDQKIAEVESSDQGVGEKSKALKELNAAKERINSDKLTSVSLKNSDVKYASRADEYNTTQHENMHNVGAKNEDLVHNSAKTLQDNKLIGAVAGTEGKQHYDSEIGKLIAKMEGQNASATEIGMAIGEQINKWKTGNVTRVIETLDDKRDVMSDVLVDSAENTPANEAGASANDKINTDALITAAQETTSAIDKLGEKLEETLKGAKSVKNYEKSGSNNMSLPDKTFWITTFNRLKKTITKGDESLGEKISSPLAALTVTQEDKENNA